MKHLCIIAFLITGLQLSVFAQKDSSLTQIKSKKIAAKTSDSSKKQPVKVKITHIPAPKHKTVQTNQAPSANVAKADAVLCFPLVTDRQYNVYDFVIQLQDSRVAARYKPYFDKRHLKFSGYVWEEVLREMLADADPEISRYLVLRSESSKILIKTTKFQVLKTFPDYICHIFSNMVKFDEYLGKVDPAKMPWY